MTLKRYYRITLKSITSIAELRPFKIEGSPILQETPANVISPVIRPIVIRIFNLRMCI